MPERLGGLLHVGRCSNQLSYGFAAGGTRTRDILGDSEEPVHLHHGGTFEKMSGEQASSASTESNRIR